MRGQTVELCGEDATRGGGGGDPLPLAAVVATHVSVIGFHVVPGLPTAPRPTSRRRVRTVSRGKRNAGGGPRGIRSGDAGRTDAACDIMGGGMFYV